MFRFIKKWFGGAGTHALGQRPAWSFSDAEPIDEAYRGPSCVDYQLDLSKWRYCIKATFRNDDPYAESEIVYASMEHEVRRSPAGQWEIRLLGGNGVIGGTPEGWEPAPVRFVDAWEQAWAERQRNGERT